MSSSWFVLSALYAPFYWTHLSLLPRWTNVHPKHILQISLLPPIIVFLLIVSSLDILNKSSRSLGVPSGGNHIHNRWIFRNFAFCFPHTLLVRKKPLPRTVVLGTCLSVSELVLPGKTTQNPSQSSVARKTIISKQLVQPLHLRSWYVKHNRQGCTSEGRSPTTVKISL